MHIFGIYVLIRTQGNIRYSLTQDSILKHSYRKVKMPVLDWRVADGRIMTWTDATILEWIHNVRLLPKVRVRSHSSAMGLIYTETDIIALVRGILA